MFKTESKEMEREREGGEGNAKDREDLLITVFENARR